MVQKLEKSVAEICEKIGLTYQIEEVGAFDPVSFDEACLSTIRQATERLGLTHRNIISGAGHDACWINQVAPSAMIMCPCVDGLSHNEAEDISKEWAGNGADVLLHAALETAEIV
jgi:N-carbamoyl-L-amino-acid hydrolase